MRQGLGRSGPARPQTAAGSGAAVRRAGVPSCMRARRGWAAAPLPAGDAAERRRLHYAPALQPAAALRARAAQTWRCGRRRPSGPASYELAAARPSGFSGARFRVGALRSAGEG